MEYFYLHANIQNQTFTGKENNNSLKPDKALQVRAMPQRSPSMLQGLRLRTDGFESCRQVCGSHNTSNFFFLP